MDNGKEITDLHFYDQTGKWEFFKEGEKLRRAKALVRGWVGKEEATCDPAKAGASARGGPCTQLRAPGP